MVELFHLGGWPVWLVLVVGLASGPLVLIGSLVRHLIHRQETQQVADVLRAAASGDLDGAVERCRRHGANPYLQVIGPAIDDHRSGVTPAQVLSRIKRNSVDRLGTMSPLDVKMLGGLVTLTAIPLAIVAYAWLRHVSIAEFLARQQVESGSGLITITTEMELVQQATSAFIQMNCGLALLLPILLLSGIAGSMILAARSRSRYHRLEWYALALLHDLHRAEHVWDEQRTRMERRLVARFNWPAFIFSWLWYLSKGMVVRGLLFGAASLIPLAPVVIGVYAGFRGNADWVASRRKRGKDPF